MRLGFGLGLSSSAPRTPTREQQVTTTYLFVDAAALDVRVRQISEKFAGGMPLKLNWPAVGRGYQKVFFYDALPGQKRSEPDKEYEMRRAEAEERHLYLQTLDRWRVYQGDARWRSGRGHEQKKVDVMIAVDMLKHTIRKNMDEAALLSSDVDFRPLLDALSDEGMFTTLVFNPRNTSAELLGAADARISLSASQIWRWLEKESQDAIGFLSERSIIYERRSGELITQWSLDDIHVEVRKKHPGSGGSSRGLFEMEWREQKSKVLSYISAERLESIYRLGEEDFGISKPIA